VGSDLTPLLGVFISLAGDSSIVMSVSVCLSVCEFVYLSVHEHILETACPNITKFSVHVACGSLCLHLSPPVAPLHHAQC